MMEDITVDPLTEFFDTIRSLVTKRKYVKKLDLFFKYIGVKDLTLKARAATFSNQARDNIWATQVINQYLRFKKESEKKEIEQIRHDYVECVKKLNCAYSLANIVEETDSPLENMLQRVSEILPPVWHYPDITCARIILDEAEFKTASFRETKLKMTSDIKIHGERVGCGIHSSSRWLEAQY